MYVVEVSANVSTLGATCILQGLACATRSQSYGDCFFEVSFECIPHPFDRRFPLYLEVQGIRDDGSNLLKDNAPVSIGPNPFAKFSLSLPPLASRLNYPLFGGSSGLAAVHLWNTKDSRKHLSFK